MQKEDVKVLNVFGKKGTMQILEFLDHGKVSYLQLQQLINTHTLNTRLRELLNYGLVQHHLERFEKRTEWYEITEKGRKVLYSLKELAALIVT